VPLEEDPCQHPNEACVHYGVDQNAEPDDIGLPCRRDEAKVFKFPEPRRASQWLRMFYLACNGSYMRFEDIYDSYSGCCEPFSPEDSPQTPATPLESPAPKGEEKPEHEDQPQELWLEEEDRQEHQAPKESLRSTKAGQRPTQPTRAPLISRAEFLRVLSKTFHGMRIYHPSGRIQSWSSGVTQCRSCSKYVVTGICYRKEPLTFPSTTRENNLRRLK
jgi:hypothetical protein